MALPLPAKVVPEPLSQLNFETIELIVGELEKAIEEVEGGGGGGEVTKAELEAEIKEREAKDKAEKEAREAADALKEDKATAATDAELANEKSERESKDNERVVGPAGATDLDVAVYDGATGKKIKDGGKTIAEILARANHTGTQTAATISDLATVVKAYRLDEFAKPTSNLDINEKKLIKVADPTEALDAANKEYVDAAASAAAAGLSIKNPASYASTANITVETETEKTLEGKCPLEIDGKAGGWKEGTRILIKDQTTKKQNGIYEVTKDESFGGTGSFGGEGKFGEGEKWKLTRASDADTTAEVKQGMFVTVINGTANTGSAWVLQTADPIEIGTTSQEFARFTASPTGTAGGDLTGTYPNPTVGEEKVLNKHIKKDVILGNKLGEGNRWYGVLEAFPTEPTPAKGDRCVVKAATGVYWECVYTGEATNPWAFVGGPPLVERSDTERTLTNKTAYESLPTDPLKITIPFKGVYDIMIEARLFAPATSGAQGKISYEVGTTKASDNWSGTLSTPAAVAMLGECNRETRHTEIPASAVITEQGRTIGNYTFGFAVRRLIVRPVRLG